MENFDRENIDEFVKLLEIFQIHQYFPVKILRHTVFNIIHTLQFHVHHFLNLTMEVSIVHWEMMELLPMKMLVVSHVTLVMS